MPAAPLTPGRLALTASMPTTVPSVYVVLVVPSAPVVVLAAPTFPLPLTRTQATVAPVAGPPNWSVTFTTSGSVRVRPVESVCPLPETTAIAAGGAGVAVSLTVTGVSVSDAASY